MLEVANEFNRAVAGADDAQMHVDVAILGTGGLDGGDLDAGRKHGFEIFHRKGPREGFGVKDLIESRQTERAAPR